MEQNNNPEISKLNMETSKKAAESLREWAGLGSTKKPVASSFLNGSTSQMLKESNDSGYAPKTKANTVFSFGLHNTIGALRNSTINDLPAGKMMLERYEYLLVEKNIPEAFVIEEFLNELNAFSWENSVTPVLENLSKIFESRRAEVEVVKTYETVKNAPGKDLFSDATDQMKNWLVSEKRTPDTLIHGLKRFGFNPMVRNLVSFLSVYENKNTDKFNIGFDNDVCEISNIYSAVEISENQTIFYASGKFLKINDETQTITECLDEEISLDLRNKAAMIADRDVNISNNKISLNLGRNRVDFVFENEDKNIYFDGKKINEAELPVAVSVTNNNILENSNNKISKAIYVSKASEDIIDLDFGKNIKSRVYEGLEANIFKIGSKIFVQTVNPSMRLNKIYETNATQAINLIQDFIKYDISESLTEFLEGEKAFLSVLKNDKNAIIKNIEILESELRKIENAKRENQLLESSAELRGLQESIEKEIDILQDKWNKINIEIEKFENDAKDLTVNEDMGYPIDTDVRVKRNGAKGKIIGVDGSSKTYTVLFSEGKTGEFFFSDVENIEDEVENFDIKTHEVDLEMSAEEGAANESNDQDFAEAPDKTKSSKYDKMFMSMYKKNMAAAPSKKTGSDPEFIDDEESHNLAEAPKSKKGSSLKTNKAKVTPMAKLPVSSSKAKGSKFIDNLDNLNLADAPSASIKGASKFIEDTKNMNLALKENQKNSHIEKAPEEKVAKPKKFVEKDKNAKLANAPGDHKKNGKKFVEDEKRASLAKAPGSKKK